MLKTANKKMAIGLLVISVIYLIASFRIPPYAYVPVDADVVPVALGFILFVLSIALYFSKDEKKGEKEKLPKKEIYIVLGVLGFILLYIFLLEILGFIVVTTLFIFFCSWFLGYKKVITNVIVSIVLPVAIYYLFIALQIQLPQGVLPL